MLLEQLLTNHFKKVFIEKKKKKKTINTLRAQVNMALY